MLNEGTEGGAHRAMAHIHTGLEAFVRLFNIFLIPFSCGENKNSVYPCPAIQSLLSVLR